MCAACGSGVDRMSTVIQTGGKQIEQINPMGVMQQMMPPGSGRWGGDAVDPPVAQHDLRQPRRPQPAPDPQPGEGFPLRLGAAVGPSAGRPGGLRPLSGPNPGPRCPSQTGDGPRLLRLPGRPVRAGVPGPRPPRAGCRGGWSSGSRRCRGPVRRPAGAGSRGLGALDADVSAGGCRGGAACIGARPGCGLPPGARYGPARAGRRRGPGPGLRGHDP